MHFALTYHSQLYLLQALQSTAEALLCAFEHLIE